MADINSITNAASYRGTPHLGSGLGVGITIDNSPLQRLATFTYYRDRDLWQKRQRDDAMAAQQIANIAAYDTRSPFKQYTDDLTKKVSELRQYVRDNPSVLIYDAKNPQKFLDLQERIGVIENDRKRATINDTLYNAAKARIELIPDKQTRDDELRILKLNADELFSNGVDDAYNQQFKVSPDLKPKDYVIPGVPLTEDFTITTKPNRVDITGIKYVDIGRIKPMADSIYFGLGQPLNENTPEFNQLSESEKERTRIENRITSRTRTNLDNIANSVNGLVDQFKAKYKDQYPNLKVADIPEEVLVQNGSIGGVISLSKSYNEVIDRINAATITKDNIKGTNYPHINLDDGASPQELIELQTFAQNKDAFISEIAPRVQQSNDEIERQRLALQRDQFDFQEKLAFGSDENSLLVGNALNDIEIQTNMQPGVYNMTPKGNKQSLANIQRLLGSTELTDDDGKIIKTPILSKEDIESNDKSKAISYEVENINGQPYVTRLQINNIWYDRGYFRNSQLNLDKEPKGGQKTSYRQSQSYLGGKKPVVETELSAEPADWKQEGNNWRYKDGRLFDSKGKEIKKK